MENEGNGSASSLPAPTLKFAQSSIAANGTATVNAPALSGTPAGATVTYSSQNPSVATVNPSTGVVQPVANGTATIVARTSATEEYAAGQASFKVVVSGIVVEVLTVTPTKLSLDSLTKTGTVNFENAAQDAVNVALGSTVKGISSSVAVNKQSVTFTLNDTENGQGGTATIKVGSKTATVTLDVAVEGGSDVGM